MTIKKGIPLITEQVANGFIVRPADSQRAGCFPGADDTLVFPTLTEYTTYLYKHYDSDPGKVGAR